MNRYLSINDGTDTVSIDCKHNPTRAVLTKILLEGLCGSGHTLRDMLCVDESSAVQASSPFIPLAFR